MNARFLASLAVLPLALSVASCSSEATPEVSGGAQFTLRNANIADNPDKLGSCPDIGTQFTVAQRGEDGNLKLVVNGADDARVTCQVDGNHFNVSVSRLAAAFSASGNYTGTQSADATVLFATDSNLYKTRTKKCTIDIDENANGRFRGRVTCPLVEHSKLPNACASTGDPGSDGSTKTYFSFANCTGF